MPEFFVEKNTERAERCSKTHTWLENLHFRVAYKRDIDDIRESPALDTCCCSSSAAHVLAFSDPYVPSLSLGDVTLLSEDAATAPAKADCVVVVTDHSNVDHSRVVEVSKLIID